MGNGIGGYSNLPTTENGNMITFSDTTTADAIFYQPKAFIGYPHVQGLYAIKYKECWNEKTLLYFMALFRKCAKGRFDYATKFTRKLALEMEVLLPTTATGDIDFAFIESRTRELEEERVRELEEERVRELEAYLRVAGFADCTLSTAECEALSNLSIGGIRSVAHFKISELFEKPALGIRKKFNKKEDVSTTRTPEYNLPLVNAKHGNNGIMYYGKECDFDAVSMSIDIVGDGAVSTGDVYPQPDKTGVLYNAYLICPKKKPVNEAIIMYYTAAIQKAIKHKYGYNNKATWEKVQQDFITLPTTAMGEIDFVFMGTAIRAMEKQCIARLKDAFAREHEAYMQVIS